MIPATNTMLCQWACYLERAWLVASGDPCDARPVESKVGQAFQKFLALSGGRAGPFVQALAGPSAGQEMIRGALYGGVVFLMGN